MEVPTCSDLSKSEGCDSPSGTHWSASAPSALWDAPGCLGHLHVALRYNTGPRSALGPFGEGDGGQGWYPEVPQWHYMPVCGPLNPTCRAQLSFLNPMIQSHLGCLGQGTGRYYAEHMKESSLSEMVAEGQGRYPKTSQKAPETHIRQLYPTLNIGLRKILSEQLKAVRDSETYWAIPNRKITILCGF